MDQNTTSRGCSAIICDALARLALPPKLGVLDLAAGTALLAGAFTQRGHGVTGLDFAQKILNRAHRRFPGVEYRNLDLRRPV